MKHSPGAIPQPVNASCLLTLAIFSFLLPSIKQTKSWRGDIHINLDCAARRVQRSAWSGHSSLPLATMLPRILGPSHCFIRDPARPSHFEESISIASFVSILVFFFFSNSKLRGKSDLGERVRKVGLHHGQVITFLLCLDTGCRSQALLMCFLLVSFFLWCLCVLPRTCLD